MTLNLSGGREPRLSWGISSSNPNEFLGDLADDPAVASLLKNSACPISLSAPGNGTGAIKVINGGSTEHRRSSFNADELLNTTQCESRGSISRTTSRDTAGSPVEADCATTRRTNGWTTSQRYVGVYSKPFELKISLKALRSVYIQPRKGLYETFKQMIV